ncbi:MAG: hypothetical protein GY754_22140 [bacterium]|nr:hypothetical protein [bacterium]
MTTTATAAPVRVNHEPRISLNKLGEYLVTRVLRRQRILKDQKYPKGFIVSRYNEVERIVCHFLASGATDDEMILNAIDDFIHRRPGSDWEYQNQELSAEALTHFLDLVDGINLRGLTVTEKPTVEQNSLFIEGVQVSVRPELVLHGTDKQGVEFSGGIKLYFSKHNPLEEKSAGYVSSLLHEFLRVNEEYFPAPGYKHCLVVDVFAGKIYSAPRSYIRRLGEIKAACHEIAAVWASL